MLLILMELGPGWVWRTSSPLELVFGGAPGLPPHEPPALCASQCTGRTWGVKSQVRLLLYKALPGPM